MNQEWRVFQAESAWNKKEVQAQAVRSVPAIWIDDKGRRDFRMHQQLMAYREQFIKDFISKFNPDPEDIEVRRI